MTVHFAQIREDPLVERALLGLTGAVRPLAIGSGGSTALSLLGDALESIVAVDANPGQCAVIEAKRAALAAFDPEDWLAFVGERPHPARAAWLAELPLSDATRAWWDAHPDAAALGANHCGSTERYYRFLGPNLRSIVPESVWNALLDGEDVGEQFTSARAAAREFSGPAWDAALRVLLSRTSHLAFFPAAMFANTGEHDFAAFFSARFREGLRTGVWTDNYFLSQLLFGRWERTAPPFFTDYATTRRNLGKLRILAARVEDVLDLEPFDALLLSNVFDWLDRAGCERLCDAILAVVRPGTAILWRRMLGSTPLPARFTDAIAPLPVPVDRSMLYPTVAAGVFT